MPFAARSLAPALSCALALSAGPALAQAAPPERPPGHLRLIDKLDRKVMKYKQRLQDHQPALRRATAQSAVAAAAA